MESEKLKILEMIEKGKISASEGLKLIEALEEVDEVKNNDEDFFSKEFFQKDESGEMINCSKSDNKEELYSLLPEEIDILKVNLVSADIKCIMEDRENILIKALKSGKYEPILNLNKYGKTASIDYKEKPNISNLFGIINLDTYKLSAVEIYLPKTFNKSVILQSSTGTVEFAGDVKLNSAEVKIIAGGLKANNLDVNSLKVSSMAGYIKMDRLKTENSRIKINAGDIKIFDLEGKLSAYSNAGSINITAKDLKDEIVAETTTGEINIKLDEKEQFDVDVNTFIGGWNCDFPVTILNNTDSRKIKGKVGQGGNLVKLNSNIGIVRVNKISEENEQE